MSLNIKFSTYGEVVSYLETVDDPQCFTVNYLPDSNEYEMWIGNQPYYMYEKWIEEEEEKVRNLREENKALKAKLYDLTVGDKANVNNQELIGAIILTFGSGDIRIHQLKTVEPYFSEVKKGNKTFEVRKFDRDYKVGDFLSLNKYEPKTGEISEGIYRRITYMLTDKPYVPEGYVILGMVDDQVSIQF